MVIFNINISCQSVAPITIYLTPRLCFQMSFFGLTTVQAENNQFPVTKDKEKQQTIIKLIFNANYLISENTFLTHFATL